MRRAHVRRALTLLLRRKRAYRRVDQVINLRLLSWLYPVARPLLHPWLPSFLKKETMGVDTLLR